MNKYYQFKVKGLGRKIDGKLYNDGDLFPYEPSNRRHPALLTQGVIEVVAAELPEPQPAPKPPTRKRSKAKS